jgi:hypothetical protein
VAFYSKGTARDNQAAFRVGPWADKAASPGDAPAKLAVDLLTCLFVKHHPEDARGIEKVLRFRRRVREEFDRLVRVSLTSGEQPPEPNSS